MAYALLLKLDPAGPSPVLLRDDEHLECGNGCRYRFIAETATWEEAEAMRRLLCQKIEAREVY